MDIEQFNPTVAELQSIVADTQKITAVDINDEAQMALVKENRLKLRDARIAITKKGKELREGAIKFQKDVIAKEKELVGIIEPEEDRLSAIEEEVKLAEAKKERLASLPSRKDKLAEIKDGIEISDDEILAMDADQFEEYRVGRINTKNAKAAEELEKMKQAERDREAAIQREAEMKEREEKARQEERERLEREAKEKEERAAREKQEADEKAEKDRIAAEEKKKADDERLEKEEKYKAFLKEHGVNDETKSKFHIIKEGNTVKLYMLTGTFIIE